MGGASDLTYPVLYQANETDFRSMGIGVLTHAKSCFVTEERNGIFESKMEYPASGSLFKELKNDRIIKADASTDLKDQKFKIIRITKPIKGIVTVYAEHVSYLSQDLALKPSVHYSGTANQALRIWENNIVDEHPFEVYSDIVLDKSGTWTIDKVENARKALGGVTGSILQSYGGEYQFDNYTIRLFQNRGVDNGALIAYGKNLTDLTQEEEISNTYTSVYPYSIIRKESGDVEVITLPEYFVDSEYLNNYARRKILVIDFSQDEIDNVDDLRSAAKSYAERNEIGVPKVNLKVQFLDLTKTLDYKDLKAVERINLCDWVTIYFEMYDIYQKAKVIKTVYDVLLERYDSLEIGQARASLTQTIDATVDNRVQPIRDQLNTVQLQANGKNKTYTQTDEPTNYQDYIVGDSWVRPIGENDRELYHWNGTNWQFLLSTLKTREAEQAITEQQAALEEVKTTADYSYDQLQQTIANSGFTDLDTAFGNVKTLSEQAESNADEAMQLAIGSDGRLTLAEQFLDGFRNTAFDPESGQLSSTEQTIAGLQDTVSDPVNGLETRITTLAGAYDSTVSKIATWTETYSVNTENPLPLKDINGNNLTPNKSYDVILGVLSTGTVTYFSASLLSNNSSWTLEIHEQNGTSSNHPYIFLNENGYPMVSLYDHTSYYNVRATITEMGSRQKSSMSAMYDEISLRVQKDDLISQINIQADRTLIQTGKLLLDTETVVFGGDAFIPGAVIDDASIDTAKIADLAVSDAKIMGLNVNKIVGNTSAFIESNWNTVANGNVRITGSGLLSDAPNGSQALIQNGVLLTRGSDGITQGYIGYSQNADEQAFAITLANGRNFKMFHTEIGGAKTPLLEVFPNSSEMYIRTDTTRIQNTLIMDSGAILMRSHDINEARYIKGEEIGNVAGRISLLQDSGNRAVLKGTSGVSLGVGRANWNGGGYVESMRLDQTYAYMRVNLSMEGHSITNQSDGRFKTDIIDYKKSSLDLIKSLRFINFRYTESNKPQSIQFGLIAQDSGDLAEYDQKNDRWSISSSRQIMHNTHGIQELAMAHENVVNLASKAYLKAESNEERIERLESELKLLKGAS